MTIAPVLRQLNIVVADMEATLAFYRALGLALEGTPDAHHVEFRFPQGMVLEFDTTDSVGHWDSGWRPSAGGGPVLGFSVESRSAVDALYGALTAAGYTGHQVPYDAFFGSRYAIVDDPDGNPVGIMSPIDDEAKTWPPSPPPAHR
jgi:catechol 2,3-dioxygenase-like lactoylglutathione lyase family enzyme